MPLDPDVASVLERWRDEERREDELLAELRAATAPTEAEQQVEHRLVRHAAESRGLTPGMLQRAQEQRSHQLRAARRLLTDQLHRPSGGADQTVRAESWSRPAFSWMRTDHDHSSHFGSAVRPDGLVVVDGGPTGMPQRTWLEAPTTVAAHFGAVALFQMPTGSLPGAAVGRWSSEPAVTVVGSLLAGAASGLLPETEAWVRSSLRLDHHIFQCRPGPDGVSLHVLGEGHSVIPLVDQAGTHEATQQPMPGHLALPHVVVDGLDPDRALWARLRVRVDVRMQGPGTFLWCNPVVRLTLRPWPLRQSR